jgi:Tol biopolymer transport system component
MAAILLILIAIAGAFYAGRKTVPRSESVATLVPAAPQEGYKRLTFRRGYISAARFAPDGQSIIYSASWVGSPEELYVTRPQNPVSRSLEIRDASLLSISKSGEMAILLKPRYNVGWQRRGTLARVPMDGEAPREILTDVQDADWSADGKNLAVAHVTDGIYRLEFPINNVLYQTKGWLDNVRISPKEDMVAFLDHPTGGDDRGKVAVVDLNGKVTMLTGEFASESGLEWSPDGSEIWFTGSIEGSNEQLIFGVTLQGKMRVVSAMVGNLIIHDIDSRGTVLLSRDSRRREIVARAPGETQERDLSWFDWSFARQISEDGKLLVFEEQGAGGGANYSVFLRKTDGSPAVKLGEGYAFSISPDRRYVISQLPNDTSHITLLPAGAGESKKISIPGFAFDVQAHKWFEDNRRLLVAGSKSGKRSSWWIFDMASEKLQPVTPEGVLSGSLISLDQTSVLAGLKDGGYGFYPVDGGPPQKAAGLENDELPVQWTSDGRSVYVVKGNQIPTQVFRVDLVSGKRTLWKEIMPSDPSGIAGLIAVVITPDGQSYAYTYRRVLSDLYLVPGLK